MRYRLVLCALLSTVFYSHGNLVWLRYYSNATADKNQYDSFSECMRDLAINSPKPFKDKVFTLDTKLTNLPPKLVSDVFIATIAELINIQDDQKIREFMKILMVFDADEHIFRALWTLHEKDRKKAFESEAVRSWWHASFGRHWLYFRTVVTKPANEFSGNYLEMCNQLDKGHGSAAQLNDHVVRNEWKKVDESKSFLFFKYDHAEWKFRISFYLTPDERRAVQKIAAKHRKSPETTYEPSWYSKLHDADHVRTFVSFWDSWVEQYKKRRESDAHCEPEEATPEEMPAEYERGQHYPFFVQGYTPVWGVGILTALIGFYKLWSLKKIEYALSRGHCWVELTSEIASDVLKEMSSEELIATMFPMLLKRCPSGTLLASNEQILADLLRKLEHEKNLIESYRAMSGRIQACKLDVVFGIDTTILAKVDDWLDRLTIMHKKVVEYIVAMQMTKKAIV